MDITYDPASGDFRCGPYTIRITAWNMGVLRGYLYYGTNLRESKVVESDTLPGVLDEAVTYILAQGELERRERDDDAERNIERIQARIEHGPRSVP